MDTARSRLRYASIILEVSIREDPCASERSIVGGFAPRHPPSFSRLAPRFALRESRATGHRLVFDALRAGSFRRRLPPASACVAFFASTVAGAPLEDLA